MFFFSKGTLFVCSSKSWRDKECCGPNLLGFVCTCHDESSSSAVVDDDDDDDGSTTTTGCCLPVTNVGSFDNNWDLIISKSCLVYRWTI